MAATYPQRFGPYVLLRPLGRGGMAEVFLAQAVSSTGEQRLVALKRMHAVLSEDDSAVEMLVEEARLAMRFTHPNIARTFELGCHEGAWYFLMEYVNGIDLGQLYVMAERLGERIDPIAIARVGLGIANGLAYAHEVHDDDGRRLGIVHRDVSPQNVLLGRQGQVKIIDFGVAKVATRIQQTMAGVIKGKYAYMSPEQASAEKVDARSDVFSLGVCLHELLTGRPLFRSETAASPFAILRAVREDPIVPPHHLAADVGEALSAIVLRCLERNVERRFQSGAELGQALAGWLKTNAPSFDQVALQRYVWSLVERAPRDGMPGAATITPPVALMRDEDFAPSALSVVARSPLDLSPEEAETDRPPRRRPPPRASASMQAVGGAVAPAMSAQRNTPPPAPPLAAIAPGETTGRDLRPSRKAVVQFLWVGVIALVFALGWSVIATLKKLGKI